MNEVCASCQRLLARSNSSMRIRQERLLMHWAAEGVFYSHTDARVAHGGDSKRE